MKIRIVLLLASISAALLLSHCCDTEAGMAAQYVVAKAAHAAAEHFLGPFAGPSPGAGCNNQGSDPIADPGEEGAAINSHHPAATCASPVTDHGACVTCATTFCCTEVVACFSEGACTCNLSKETPDIQWPADEPCDAPDHVFKTADTCLRSHCAAQCLGAP